MSTERLTAEWIACRSDIYGNIGSARATRLQIEIELFAAQEVEQQTKRLQEERDKAVERLKQFVRGDIKDLLLPSEKRLINTFLDQLNR